MKWFKRNPVFFTMLLLMACSLVASAWITAERSARLQELVSQYESHMRQLDAYVNRPIAPTRANLEALENNFALLYRQYEKVSSLLNLTTYNEERLFGEPPESSTEAFFQIAEYIASSRKLIAAKEIGFDEESRFGFSAYANKGPAPDEIAKVHRQVRIMEVLIQSLAESGITEFQRIQREPFEGDAVPERRAATERRDHSLTGDLFRIHPHASMERDELIDCLAFRVAFKGQSLSLRNFVNRIVNSSLPFVIRGIEVDLTTPVGEGSERLAIGENPFFNDSEVDRSVIQAAQVPIISENESSFVVTLEFLDMLKQVEPPARQEGNLAALEGGPDV